MPNQGYLYSHRIDNRSIFPVGQMLADIEWRSLKDEALLQMLQNTHRIILDFCKQSRIVRRYKEVTSDQSGLSCLTSSTVSSSLWSRHPSADVDFKSEVDDGLNKIDGRDIAHLPNGLHDRQGICGKRRKIPKLSGRNKLSRISLS